MTENPRIDDLRSRLEDAAVEATAWRSRYEVALQDLTTSREQLAEVCAELAMVRASRTYRAAERARRLLRR